MFTQLISKQNDFLYYVELQKKYLYLHFKKLRFRSALRKVIANQINGKPINLFLEEKTTYTCDPYNTGVSGFRLNKEDSKDATLSLNQLYNEGW